MKALLYRIYWFLKSTFPPMTRCDYCGRWSPYYLDDCPHHKEDIEMVLTEYEEES